MRKLLLFVPLLTACGAAAAQQPPALASWPAAKQDPATPRTIAVTGTGTIELTPDRAIVTLAVETQAGTAQEAARLNAQRMDAVITAVRRAGIPEARIRTTGYQLHPEYRHERDREPTLIGYRASNRVMVTVDSIPRVGPIIDTAIGAGANRVDGLHFGLRDPETSRQQALRLAVDNARQTAQTLAAAAGVGVGEPIQISVAGAWAPPPPAPPMPGVRMDAQAVETPIQPGQVSFSATVNIVYAMTAR